MRRRTRLCHRTSRHGTEKASNGVDYRCCARSRQFPGVGNIIKVEGLHRAKVHPQRKVASLSDEVLRTVVTACRAYAREWLKLGRHPTQHVYNQTICQTCHQKSVRMAKMGQDLSRITFWCEPCCDTGARALGTNKRPADHFSSVPPTVATKKARQEEPKAPFKPAQEDRPQQGCCPQHGTRWVRLRRVRKVGPTQHRLFYTCQQPHGPQCPYFAWADAHLPNCHSCHQKTRLRVSKKEHSGGQWFLSCGGVTCSKYFAWATPAQLQPLGNRLTPLL